MVKPTWEGSLFSCGDMRIAENVFDSSDGAVTLGNYSFYDGDDIRLFDSRRGFARIVLPMALPHIYLRARRSLQRHKTVPKTFVRHEILHVEGDFERYFTLFVAREPKERFSLLSIRLTWLPFSI